MAQPGSYFTRFKLPAFAAAAVFLLAGFLDSPALAARNMFLDSSETVSYNLTPFVKWTGVMQRYEETRNSPAAGCSGPQCKIREWESLLTSLEGKPQREQIEQVNRFFNAVTYILDSNNWGMVDYWATPYEFMDRGGDCEDYAIAKFISLKRLGFPVDKMRIVILQDFNLGGIMHAVLEVNYNGDKLILDNQAQQVISQSKIFHYKPIYSINEKAWWTYR